MFSTEDIIKEVQREINMRKRVFPTWVLQGRITQQQIINRNGKRLFCCKGIKKK